MPSQSEFASDLARDLDPNSELIQLLSDLVEINSINPDLVPDGPGEGAVGEFIATWLRAWGCEVETQPIGSNPNRRNIIGIARGRDSKNARSFMLNGHMDTVGVAGMTEPWTPRIANGRLYGRGAYDMKCGLAAALVATARAKQANLRGDVIVTAVVDEEYAGLGTMEIVKRYKADAAIVAEPTELRAVIAHKGFVWVDIETHGVAAHGSRPDLGIDAIAKMGRVLTELEALDRQLRAQPTHPLLKSGSLHASLISGGQELSSYPERCTVSIERRTIPGETPDIVEAQMQDIVQRLSAIDPAFRASVRRGVHREPMETDPNSALVQSVREHSQRIVGQVPEIVGAPYWTDAATLSQAGIPAILFGPSGTGAHAVEEWVDLRSVAQSAHIYLAIARQFCA